MEIRVMEIQAVELWRLDLRLVTSLLTSAGEHSARPLLVVFIHTKEGSGVGECSALAEPTYTDEYSAGAEAVLAEHLIPRLLHGGGAATLEELLGRLAPIRGQQMAKAAIEMALLDLDLRTKGHSLASFLGATQRFVPAGATVGIGEPDEVVASVASAVEAGYGQVKCKIAPGRDLATLRALRHAFPELPLSADANAAYDLSDRDQHEALLAIDRLGLVALEQPLRPFDLIGHRDLCAELATPVVLDESVKGPDTLQLALELRACDGVSVKPARVGGILNAKKVHDACLAAGVHLSIGGMLESGIGRAAALAVAALPGFDLPGDLGASDRYFSPDPSPPHLLLDGALAVPNGPGLGVELDLELLAAAAVGKRTFAPS